MTASTSTSTPIDTALHLRAQLDQEGRHAERDRIVRAVGIPCDGRVESPDECAYWDDCDGCPALAACEPGPLPARTPTEAELLEGLTAEEQSAIRNLLTAPTLTLSDERSTVLELTAAEQAIELLWAALRARKTYLLVVGAGR